MTWSWFALRSTRDEDDGAHASAAVSTPEGNPVGFFVAWPSERDQPGGAVKIASDGVDGDGEAGWVSLVLAGEAQSLPLDDPAVSEALRKVLALPPARVFSTLSLSDDRWLGSLTACDERDERLRGDPFGVLLTPRILMVERGFLGTTPALPGPVIQRYGGDSPWPASHFPTTSRS